MSQIRHLFDSSRALSRPIDKVITYQNRSEEGLRAEISEYVITEDIELSMQDLLDRIHRAQQDFCRVGGVWVSGCFGSGKSSFTKYLGCALDPTITINGAPVVKFLENQFRSSRTSAILDQVSADLDAAVLFLDLAREMLAGASTEDFSTLLYFNALQWAGYSDELKVAEFELMLEAEGRFEAFKARVKEELNGIDWIEVHNQPLVANQIAAHLATEFYPNLFERVSDFYNISLPGCKPEDRRAEKVISLIQRKSGKKNVIFIIDELGLYVGAKGENQLGILNLFNDFEVISDGIIWIFATFSSDLTASTSTCEPNGPNLRKLKERLFPIQIHLEASDIAEICHKRLLKKSADGEAEVNKLFEHFGGSLRYSTHLTNASAFKGELTAKLFVDLYPFLPAHFDMLIQLLDRLAWHPGGRGVGSAMKVVQTMLLEQRQGRTPLGDSPVGRLATTVTLYDSLLNDIQNKFPQLVAGVIRVEEGFPNEPLYTDVAKSIAVLQIIDALPVTVSDLTALMQAEVKLPLRNEDVEKAVSAMLAEGKLPLTSDTDDLQVLTVPEAMSVDEPKSPTFNQTNI